MRGRGELAALKTVPHLTIVQPCATGVRGARTDQPDASGTAAGISFRREPNIEA